MASFKDSAGTTWQFALTVGHLAPLREVGVDLNRAVRDKSLVSLTELEFEVLVRAVYLLCEPQAEKAGLTPEKFGYLFDGPTLAAAGEALLVAVVDFFHRPEPAAKLKEQLRTYLSRLDQATVKRLQATEPAVLQKIETLTWNGSAGNSPESSGSTPDP